MAGTLDPTTLRHTHEVRPLFLVGFMGAGKSTVGRIVADRLGRPFRDLDTVIEAEAGATVEEIFASVGEPGFRVAERAALELVSSVADVVCACGGGVVTHEESRSLLETRGDVVYLVVGPDEALARCGTDSTVRPLLREGGLASASGLLASRTRLYEAVADLTVATSGRTPEQVAASIVEWVRR